MNELLKTGQCVTIESSGGSCEVVQFLGGGGQGEVYRAKLGDEDLALKWYYPHAATPEQRQALETLVKSGPPTDKFLWPLALAVAPAKATLPGFGYVMRLREPRYKGIVDLMKRRIDPSFRVLATAGLQLAHSYLQLHAKGLCYRDISFGNVFFDPQTGEVLICDNDNVAVNGQALGGVLGTPRFMAPEVVCGTGLPGTETDLFSLAVLLFYVFMIHHPLEGRKEAAIKCLDLPAMNKLYGTEPVFIFDPVDRSNEPVPGCHDNATAFWPIYPKFLRDLFTRAFTVGIKDPQHGRVRESEWRAALVRLRDAIVYCAHCGGENFYDAEALPAAGGKPAPCWSCRKEISLPYRIRIAKNVIMLNHDTQLFPHHLDDQKLWDFDRPVAEVARHPTNPSVWGLKNLTPEKWVSTATDGSVKDVEPGRSATLAAGAKINFGKTEGEVRI